MLPSFAVACIAIWCSALFAVVCISPLSSAKAPAFVAAKRKSPDFHIKFFCLYLPITGAVTGDNVNAREILLSACQPAGEQGVC